MSLVGSLTISTQGMSVQSTRLGSVASNMANIDTSGYRSVTTNFSTLSGGSSNGVQASVSPASPPQPSFAGTSDVDPLVEMTGMILAAASFAANAAVFETGADMWQVLATIPNS